MDVVDGFTHTDIFKITHLLRVCQGLDMIEFQKAFNLEASKTYMDDCLSGGHLSGDGKYTELCCHWIRERLSVPEVLMTTSCTHALELALNILNLGPEDEVIVPSYTYPSTANAVLMAGGKVVFSEVRSSDLTMDPDRLAGKINHRTKAIIPVHYAGNVCQMDALMAIARTHGLMVIEDSAQGFLAAYKGQYAGTFGDFGCFSFHGTKDFVAGEGGALCINNPSYIEQAGFFHDKGTNRTAFVEGRVSRYEWVAKGSSYSPSELVMALLYGQLTQAEAILQRRKAFYDRYVSFFKANAYPLLDGYSMPAEEVTNNGHTYWIRFHSPIKADGFRRFMKQRGINAYSHFVPLHSSMYGQRFQDGGMAFDVEKELGRRLIRLPLYPDLTENDFDVIIEAVTDYMEMS